MKGSAGGVENDHGCIMIIALARLICNRESPKGAKLDRRVRRLLIATSRRAVRRSIRAERKWRKFHLSRHCRLTYKPRKLECPRGGRLKITPTVSINIRPRLKPAPSFPFGILRNNIRRGETRFYLHMYIS